MRDAGRFIESALRSLQAQSHERWEALVVDDGSADDGPRIVGELMSRDRRLRLIEGARGGPGAARNIGVQSSRGSYMMFLDADDTLASGALAALLPAARESGASYGGCAWMDEEGDPLGFSSGPTVPCAGFEDLARFNRFPVHGQMIRREALGEARFDGSLRAYEDWDLWLRLATGGVSWRAVYQDVASYRMVRGSRSRRWDEAARAGARVMERWLDPFEAERRAARLMLDAATSCALEDDSPGCDASALLLRGVARAGSIGASEAAESARWCVPLAACRSPACWKVERPEWLRALARLWGRFVREGWAKPGFVPLAITWLGRAIVEESEVDRALAEDLDHGRPVVLLGLGQNGRRLARMLATRGHRVEARDRSLREAREIEVDGVPILAKPWDARVRGLDQYVATPGDDRGMVESLPVCLDLRRWSEVREGLSIRAVARLMRAWPWHETGLLGEAA